MLPQRRVLSESPLGEGQTHKKYFIDTPCKTSERRKLCSDPQVPITPPKESEIDILREYYPRLDQFFYRCQIQTFLLLQP
jgi:hypothetical protein